MGCTGCATPAGGCLTIEGKPIDCRLQTHAAMCMTCPRFRRSDELCTAGDRPAPARERVLRGTCPLGRAPDARGRVTVRGVRYRGVPVRLRLLLWWRGEIPNLSHLAGCGCRDSWKRSAARLRWSWREARRDARALWLAVRGRC